MRGWLARALKGLGVEAVGGSWEPAGRRRPRKRRQASSLPPRYRRVSQSPIDRMSRGRRSLDATRRKRRPPSGRPRNGPSGSPTRPLPRMSTSDAGSDIAALRVGVFALRVRRGSNRWGSVNRWQAEPAAPLGKGGLIAPRSVGAQAARALRPWPCRSCPLIAGESSDHGPSIGGRDDRLRGVFRRFN